MPLKLAGLTVAIEGIDGSGKTTLVRALAERLHAHSGIRCLAFSWFHDPEVHKIARVFNSTGVMTPEVLAAIHACHTLSLVAQSEASRCDLRLFDRYFFSSFAACVVRGVDRKCVEQLAGLFPVPTLTVLLDVPPHECLRRVRDRGGSSFYELGLDRLHPAHCRPESLARFREGTLDEDLVWAVCLETMQQSRAALLRAIAAVPHLVISSEESTDVASLCQRLEEHIQKLRSGNPEVDRST